MTLSTTAAATITNAIWHDGVAGRAERIRRAPLERERAPEDEHGRDRQAEENPVGEDDVVQQLLVACRVSARTHDHVDCSTIASLGVR